MNPGGLPGFQTGSAGIPLGTSAIYAGTVAHRRLRPKRHRLRYRVFSLLLDIDEVPALCGRLRLLSHCRFNLFSFDERDHADGTGTSLRDWAETMLFSSSAQDGLIDATELRRLWEEHQSGARDWQHLFWSVLMLRGWQQHRLAAA